MFSPDQVNGLENDLNHQITSVPPGEVCPGLIPEVPVDDRGEVQLYIV